MGDFPLTIDSEEAREYGEWNGASKKITLGTYSQRHRKLSVVRRGNRRFRPIRRSHGDSIRTFLESPYLFFGGLSLLLANAAYFGVYIHRY